MKKEDFFKLITKKVLNNNDYRDIKLSLENNTVPDILDSFDRHDSSPLHIACYKNDYRLARILLQHDADPFLKRGAGLPSNSPYSCTDDCAGNTTVIQSAKNRGYSNIIALFERYDEEGEISDSEYPESLQPKEIDKEGELSDESSEGYGWYVNGDDSEEQNPENSLRPRSITAASQQEYYDIRGPA